MKNPPTIAAASGKLGVQETGAPVAGNDVKTGQTWMKTLVAPGIKARLLGVEGWYSTNILGNRDGEVLDDPESFKTKELKNTLRFLKGEELITHLGLEYYD